MQSQDIIILLLLNFFVLIQCVIKDQAAILKNVGVANQLTLR